MTDRMIPVPEPDRAALLRMEAAILGLPRDLEARQEWARLTHTSGEFHAAVRAECYRVLTTVAVAADDARRMAELRAAAKAGIRSGNVPALTYPCGHHTRTPGCGGCDPGAVEYVRDDGGPWRRTEPGETL